MKTIVLANQSPFVGVTYVRLSGKWQARIQHEKRCYFLGVYATPEEAAIAVDRKAIELRGASARLNFPGHSPVSPQPSRTTRMPPQFESILTAEFLRREYVEKGRTADEIAASTGISCTSILAYARRAGLKVRTRRDWLKYAEPTNLGGFMGPAGDWHAYWLGFIAADGCVFTKGADGRPHNVVRIQLKSDDAAHLEEFRRGLGTDVPVRTANGKTAVTLHSPTFVRILRSWGIIQKKSLILTFPAIPKPLLGAFIRGYFDGDGTIYWRHRGGPPQPVCRFISGSADFLNSLRGILSDHGIATTTMYQSTGNAHHLPLSSRSNNLRKFADFIYRSSTVHLTRKHLAFQPIMEKSA